MHRLRPLHKNRALLRYYHGGRKGRYRSRFVYRLLHLHRFLSGGRYLIRKQKLKTKGYTVKLIKKCDPRDVDVVELGKDEYVDRLYGCFRFDNPLTEGFKSEQEIVIVLRPEKSLKITVPESMKIDLPRDCKVVNSDMFRIDPIGDNGDTMHLLTMRAGWNQNDNDINRIIGLDPEGVFCTKLFGGGFEIPIGTCVVSPLGGKNTWIGMILVHPELRRQGIATVMMRHCIQYAIDHGKVINGLDATPMGSTVYVNVGYAGTFRIWRCIFQTGEFSDAVPKRARPMDDETLEEVIRYDSACFMERGNVLRALYADCDGDAYYYPGDDGKIAGYVLARPGRMRPSVGPLMADSQEAAADLLAAVALSLKKKGYPNAFIDTPEIWFADPGVYDKSVFDQVKKPSGHCLVKTAMPVRDFLRMYQIVDYRKADALVDNFAAKQGLPKNDPRVIAFAETMHRSVANYTETAGFMEFEERALQKKLWATSGPEKG